MGRVNINSSSSGANAFGQISFEKQKISDKMEKIEKSLNNTKKYNINNNVKLISKKYPVTKDGYFGEKSNSSNRRVIKCDDPVKEANDFFSKISNGYSNLEVSGDRKVAKLPDNTFITYRIYTKTSREGKSPAVDINIKKSSVNTDIKNQKIHFEEKEK